MTDISGLLKSWGTIVRRMHKKFSRSSCKGLCLFAAVVLCHLPLQAEESVPLPFREIVIEPATDEHPRSDAACVTQLSDGRLMMVYQKSHGGTAHDGGYKRIWSRTSSDGGLTWGEARSLIDAEDGYIYAAGPSILKLKSGVLLLSCVGLRKDEPLTTQFLFRSDDGGRTFHAIKPIWDRTHRDTSQGGATSLVQLTSGRLLLPVSCYLGPELAGKKEKRNASRSAWCFFSDDEGRTWKESAKVILPMRGALEPSVAQLADGRLIMSLRTQLGGPYLSWSDNNGADWSDPVFSGLEGGESCTVIRRIPGSKDIVLIWNNSKYLQNGHSHFGDRTPLTSAVSQDGGKTWGNVRKLFAEPGVEYTNPNCFFTLNGWTIVTYMFASSGFGRERASLRAAIFDTQWLYSPSDD